MAERKPASRLSRSKYRRRLNPALLVIALTAVIVPAVTSVASDRPTENDAPLRAVRSSLAQGERVLALSTASLYARNDPWKAYLASEKACPGAERTGSPGHPRLNRQPEPRGQVHPRPKTTVA